MLNALGFAIAYSGFVLAVSIGAVIAWIFLGWWKGDRNDG